MITVGPTHTNVPKKMPSWHLNKTEILFSLQARAKAFKVDKNLFIYTSWFMPWKGLQGDFSCLFTSLFTLFGHMTNFVYQSHDKNYTRRFMPWKGLQGDVSRPGEEKREKGEKKIQVLRSASELCSRLKISWKHRHPYAQRGGQRRHPDDDICTYKCHIIFIST